MDLVSGDLAATYLTTSNLLLSARRSRDEVVYHLAHG